MRRSLLMASAAVLTFFTSAISKDSVPSGFSENPQPTLGYVLQAEKFGKSKAAAVRQLEESGRDVLVIDEYYNEEEPWSAEEIRQIRSGKPGRKVLAYLSIGEAERYRRYWKKAWDDDPPAWLLGENPDWPGNFRVQYWNREWQDIVFGSLERITAAGFDGVYLDIVDAFETFEYEPGTGRWRDHLENPDTGKTYRADMVEWVQRIAKVARESHREFLIVPQNGVQLLAESGFLEVIDAVGVEDLFTEDGRMEPKDAEFRLSFLREVRPKPVFVIEYGLKGKLLEQVRDRCEKLGFSLLVTDRQLTQLGTAFASPEIPGTGPVFETSFETETFRDDHSLNLPVRNWFEFAARHREDGGDGDGKGGASAVIEKREGRTGERSLKLELADITKSRRSEFDIWPPESAQRELSVSVWLKLPEDFSLRAPGIDWNWMEFCVLGSEQIDSPRGKLWSYLRLTIDQPDPDRPAFDLALGGRRGIEHAKYLLGKVENFPLPRGRWFNVHYCLLRDPKKGAVKVWVEGRLVFDFADIPTTEGGSEFKISPAKLYYEPTDLTPKQIWVDDVTIWPGWVEPMPTTARNPAPKFEWEPIGLGGGGWMTTPAISGVDPDRMLLNCDMSGAYRSADGGKSWEMIHHSQLRGNTDCRPCFHPTDPDTVFAAHGWAGQLRVSKDGGKTFQPIGNLPDGLTGEIRIDPDDPKRMLAGVGKDLWFSVDAAGTWKRSKGFSGELVGMHIDRSSPKSKRRAFAATKDGANFRSEDGGASWSRLQAGLPQKPILSFAGASSQQECALYVSFEPWVENGNYAGGIFASFDHGKTWESRMSGGINADSKRHDRWAEGEIAKYEHLLASDAAPRTVFAFNTSTGFNPPHHNTAWKSEDGGASWQAVLYADPRWKEYNVQPNWHTVNVGQNYQMVSTGAAISNGDADRVISVDAMRCFVTHDGGSQWVPGHSQEVGNFSTPEDSRWNHQGLLVTTTWDYLIDPDKPEIHYICYTDIGFARSTDAGKTWNWWGKGRWAPWRNTCYQIAPDGEKAGVLWGAFSEVHDIPNQNIILGRHRSEGNGGIAVSRDYGASWSATENTGLPNAPATGILVLGKGDSRRLVAAVWEHGVFESRDEGTTWKKLGDGPGNSFNRRVSRLQALPDGALLALVTAKRKNTHFEPEGPGLYRLAPGGSKWEPLTSPGQFAWPKDFTLADSSGSKIFLGVADAGDESGGLYLTSDGGKNWKRILREGAEHFGGYPDPARPGRVYATLTEGAPGAGLFLSQDGGDTFQPVESFPFSNVQRVVFDDSNPEVIYVTTFGGGMWRGKHVAQADLLTKRE